MLAQKDEYIQDASNTIYQLSQEEMIRLQCQAREDYYRRQRSVERRMQEQSNTIQEQENIIAEQQDTIAALQAEMERLRKG